MELDSPQALVLIKDDTNVSEFAIVCETLGRGGVLTMSAFVLDASYGSVDPGEYPPMTESCIHIQVDSWLDFAECSPDDLDLVVIPGGTYAAKIMSEHPSVQELVRRFIKSNKLVGMIGAGSLVEKTAQLPRQPLTSHSSVKAELEKDFDYSEEAVVVSENLITSRGPGTAFQFALTIVEKLRGTEKRNEICGAIMLPPQNPL